MRSWRERARFALVLKLTDSDIYNNSLILGLFKHPNIPLLAVSLPPIFGALPQISEAEHQILGVGPHIFGASTKYQEWH